MTPAETTAPSGSVRLPFCDLNHLEVLEVGGGRARCATTAGPWLAGSDEFGIPSAAAALADMVLMYACSTRSTPGMMPVTATLRVDLWTDPPPVGSRLVGEAEVQGADGDLLLVSGRIGVGGRTVATATIRSMLVPLVIGPGPSLPGATPVSPVAAETPHPSATPTARSSAAVPEAPTPAVDAVLALPAAVLAGMELVALGDERIDLTARPGADLERTGGVLHGGAVPLLSGLASSALLAATIRTQQRPRRLDLTADYIRPTPMGTSLSVTSTIVQRTRRLIKIHSEILDAGGRITARVYETAALDSTA
ncbi:MAG: hotdog fold thioesterase [Acidobacteriota bacterium]|nr:hotdog fold thioesterase [Acidobacteriota bacterium]